MLPQILRRYGAYSGDDPVLVGMAEMFVDVESEEQGAWKIMYIFVDGRRHHRVRCAVSLLSLLSRSGSLVADQKVEAGLRPRSE